MSILIALAAVTAELTAPGPNGPLTGTLLDAGRNAPVVLIVPGSGPTDRDGNNPLGVTAAPYRLLAEALAEKGVSTLRIDKRGMFGSKVAIADPNAVTIADYAADVHAWIGAIRARTGAECAWVLGHSEGGIVALAAAQDPLDICGVILVAAPGRKLGALLREQLKANPANAPLLDPAMAAIGKLEAGEKVDVSAMPAPLQMLFAPPVQSFLIDMMAKDPAQLISKLSMPVLVVSGGRDMQVAAADAEALVAAQPKAKIVNIAQMNHVLKDVASDNRSANLATYADPSLPVDAQLVEAVAAFVRR